MYKETINKQLDALKTKLPYINETLLVVDPVEYVSEFKNAQLVAFIDKEVGQPILLSDDGFQISVTVHYELVFTYPREWDENNIASNFLHAFSLCTDPTHSMISMEIRSSWVHENLYGEIMNSDNYKMMSMSCVYRNIINYGGCELPVC